MNKKANKKGAEKHSVRSFTSQGNKLKAQQTERIAAWILNPKIYTY
jgi:hypothetical protein